MVKQISEMNIFYCEQPECYSQVGGAGALVTRTENGVTVRRIVCLDCLKHDPFLKGWRVEVVWK